MKQKSSQAPVLKIFKKNDEKSALLTADCADYYGLQAAEDRNCFWRFNSTPAHWFLA
jgi:hypothetical protein